MRHRLPVLVATLLSTIPAIQSAQPGPAYRNLGVAATYVGDAACASCHLKQAASYPGTAMGRAFTTAAEFLKSDPAAIPPKGVSFDQAKTRCRYRVFVEDGLLKHSEIRLDEQGREAFTDTRTVSYVLGSGDRGRTFLIRSGDRLYQSPLAYRRSRDGWGMAAGYDSPRHQHFGRPVTAPCLFCHTNRAAYLEGTINEYADPPFDGWGIGCERCHGPGSLHVSERRSLPPTATGIDLTIVNPRRLPAALRDDVCLQCHLQGNARVLKADHPIYSYRPGLPLADFFAIYHAVGTGGHAKGGGEGIEVVSHVERLRRSRCWKQSQGAISCLTCHDPHKTPRGEEAVRQFRSACLTCHKLTDCSMETMKSGAAPSGADPSDCVACHMAKRPPTDAPHTLFTDHLISRRPLPAAPTSGTESKEITLVSFLEKDGGSRRDLGAAYLVFATGSTESPYAARGASLLESLLPDLKGDFNALRLLAEYHQQSGRPRERLAALERLSRAAPRLAEARVELARLYGSSGREALAQSTAREAVAEDPAFAPARQTLGDLLMDAGSADAKAQFLAAVRLDPSVAGAHAGLGELARRAGDLE
ncbi:MAG TPA: cytochrome c3 family protein, partial [Candidatus Polarisedimenticolia bacterium]|nr:cytochrome c3 family protein [Candidatus Polarisedimenticolia bacterium]